MSIKEILQKIKYYRDVCVETAESRDIFIVLLLILTAGISFGFGTLFAQYKAKTPIKIQQSSSIFESIESTRESRERESSGQYEIVEGKYVGSVNSDKYHYPWCPGAKRIHPENKIWFTDKAEAKARGYTPAGNCEGL